MPVLVSPSPFDPLLVDRGLSQATIVPYLAFARTVLHAFQSAKHYELQVGTIIAEVLMAFVHGYRFTVAVR
jgi:hypothetical protein